MTISKLVIVLPLKEYLGRHPELVEFEDGARDVPLIKVLFLPPLHISRKW